MIKYELRECGFSVEEKKLNKHIINTLWAFFTILLSVFAITMLFTLGSLLIKDSGYGGIAFEANSGAVLMYFLELIFFVFLYFAMKFLLTLWFCSNKYNSVNLKFLEDNNFPVCYCREALKIPQTIIIYTLPAIVVYTVMFWISVTISGEPFQTVEAGFMTMLFFMSFIIAFDLTLAVCVLFIKIINKSDYISIDHHVYKMTAYRGTYVRIGGKKTKTHIEIAENTPKRRMFTKIKTCLNPECESYTHELGKNAKICPSCGGRAYMSEVLENVTTCVNNNCGNYGQELKKGTETCELCGAKTKPLAFDFNHRLAAPSIAMVFITTVIFPFIFLYMDNLGVQGGFLFQILDYIRFGLIITSMIASFLSKNRIVFITTLLSLPVSSIFMTYIFLIM